MTAQRLEIQAQPRTVVGRRVKHLRSAGKIPANIFGKNVQSTAVELDTKIFSKIYTEAGETSLIQISIAGEGKSRPVLIREVSYHPVTHAILHVDFQQVNLSEKITAMIPVEVVGESEAVKSGGVLVIVHNEIEVEALPTDLPESFTIDISSLATIGDTITAQSLQYDRSKIAISVDDEEVLATVQAQEEEVVAEVSTEPVEVELVKQGATKEDEANTDAS